MERIALRELRNHASRVVRRASSGERIIITVDGVPTAQIVPLDTASLAPTLEELVRQGRLIAPRSTTPAPPAVPMPARDAGRLSDVVDDLRDG